MSESDSCPYKKLFPDFKKANGQALCEYLRSFQNLIYFLEDYQYEIGTFVILLNIIHIVILSRKQMRISSTNVVMIGMAIAEIILYLEPFHNYLRKSVFKVPQIFCLKNSTYFYSLHGILTTIYQLLGIRSSVYLAVVLVLIRTLTVKYATESRFDFIATSKFGWKAVIWTFIFCLISSSMFFVCTAIHRVIKPWPEEIECTMEMMSSSYYGKNIWLTTVDVSNAIVFNVIPGLFSPILTFLLISNIRKAKRRTGTSTKKDPSKFLMVYISASFTASELPKGIIFLLQELPFNQGTLMILKNITRVCVAIAMFNSATRGLISYLMSSQYRGTVKNMFSFNKIDDESE